MGHNVFYVYGNESDIQGVFKKYLKFDEEKNIWSNTFEDKKIYML